MNKTWRRLTAGDPDAALATFERVTGVYLRAKLGAAGHGFFFVTKDQSKVSFRVKRAAPHRRQPTR